MEFKDRFKKYRIENNLTQEQISNLCFVSRTTVSRWETGLTLPDKINLERLCIVLNVSQEVLLGDITIEQKNIKKNVLIKKYLNVSIILSILVICSFIVLICFIPSIIRTISYQKDNIIEVECPDISINDNHICRKVNPYKRYEGYSYSTSGNYMPQSYLMDLKGYQKEESYNLNIDYDFDYFEIKYYYLDSSYNYLKYDDGYYEAVDQNKDYFGSIGFNIDNPTSIFYISSNDYINLIRIDIFKNLKDGLIRYRYYFMFE